MTARYDIGMDDTVTTKRGEDLFQSDIEQINQAFKRVFPENKLLALGGSELEDNTFFFIYDPNKNIIATGRLRPIKLFFKEDEYNIQGVADIISNKPGQGYGKKIMSAIRQWLEDHNEVGIGFCENTSEFYQKSGFKIYPGLTSRFYYPNSWTGVLESYNSDVLYWGASDKLISSILTDDNERVFIPYPW